VKIAGLIFAGGKSTRFGGPKEEAVLAGHSLLSHVVSRATPQVDILAISRAGRHQADAHGLPIVIDEFPGCGPLGGLHAGLRWAHALTPRAEYLATFACDTPFIPRDLVERLLKAATGAHASAAIAATGADTHPTLGLWSTSLEPLARRRLLEGANSLRGMADASGAVAVGFDSPAPDFFNVNAPADLATLEKILGASPQ